MGYHPPVIPTFPTQSVYAMGKLLKVLVVVIFVLALAAFWMGFQNFGKRELLIGRTRALEDFAKKIVTTIEASEPEDAPVVNHPEWDVDDVTDRPNDNPQMSSFWESYEDRLEGSAPTMSFRGKDSQLAAYYKMSNGKVETDVQGRPKTDGKGTMNELLEDAFQKAKDQTARLLATREQMKSVREKFEDVIEMLNEEKKLRRTQMAEVVRARQLAEEKENQFIAKEGEVARLNREKDDLNDEISSLNDQIAERDQSIADLKSQIERLRSDITKITFDSSSGGGATTASAKRGDEPTKDAWTPGVKGKVVKVDGELSFVVVGLSPEAAAEIRPEEGQTFAPVEMMVRRKGADGNDRIVTRIRIVNPPNSDNLAIADNMYGWEQVPVEVGDDVVY